MLLSRARDRVSVPWKNGRGSTVDVAIGPPGASLTDFDWRVSLAGIRGDVPFSLFPGMDRILTVVEGPGMTLTATSGEMLQAHADRPISFPGETAFVCQLHQGPVTAFNVMTRRGSPAGSVEIVSLPTTVVHRGAVTLVVALRDSMTAAEYSLAAWDAVQLAPEDGDVELTGVGVAAIVRIG
ncbi:HutD family protein [Pendulispora rubella]|uniref:HutD family protein n=1 Tax=Pendulispora rubella TaxID=2741070 RepID=A0ABZ2KVJ7_9BACT